MNKGSISTQDDLEHINFIGMSELHNQESHIESFNKPEKFWMEYPLFIMSPIFFININDDFDKKELCDLKLLYELKTSEETKLVDYGFKYALKQEEIIEILLSPIDYKTIDELVKIAEDDYDVAMDENKINILMSIKNNESIIKLEKQITANYIELLVMVDVLCKTVDPKYIDLLGLRYISTIEDLYNMCNCVHAGLKKIELELTKSMNLLKENRELAQDEIEEKIKSIQAAIKHFDTWMIEKNQIKKLHSFQSEYIIDKLRERVLITYPWPQYIEESEDPRITRILPTQSDINSPLELKQNSQDINEDPEPVEVKLAWLSTNQIVIFILLKILLIFVGMVYVVIRRI